METARKVILKGIEEEKERENKRLEDLKEEVKEIDNTIEMFGKLIEVYGNSLEQRPITIRYLKEILEDNFFKKAEVKARVNGIEFKKGRYKITFPTSRVKVIKVEYKNDTEKYREKVRDLKQWKYEKEWLEETIKLTASFLEKKTLSNIKKLTEQDKSARHSSMKVLSMFDNKAISNYLKIYKHYDKKRLLEMKEEVKSCVEKIKVLRQEVKEQEEEIEEAKKYIGSITDLDKFEDKGYTIKRNKEIEKVIEGVK